MIKQTIKQGFYLSIGFAIGNAVLGILALILTTIFTMLLN